jgi:hypothetical protein
LSEQSKTIPVLQSGYFGTPPPSALLMTLYVVYAGGGKEYVPVGASWLSSNQSAAYIAASASGDYVYGLKTADNVKITASFKGFKTSFVVNVSEDQAPKLLSYGTFLSVANKSKIPMIISRRDNIASHITKDGCGDLIWLCNRNQYFPRNIRG